MKSELINEKDKNLNGLKDAVVSSIGDSVQTQLKSYSEAIQGQASTNCSKLLNSNVLKTVIKDVVAEEDRSRNLLIFGLPEESDVEEEICEKVGKVLEELGVKPRFEANMIGNAAETSAVKVSNATTVNQILFKARTTTTNLVNRF